MRQWLINPKLMCDRHLIGEHVEHHMFIGAINKGRKLEGYFKNNCLQIDSLNLRHESLVREMGRRGMKHNSPLPPISVTLPEDPIYNTKISPQRNLILLLERCEKCRKNYDNLLKEGDFDPLNWFKLIIK